MANWVINWIEMEVYYTNPRFPAPTVHLMVDLLSGVVVVSNRVVHVPVLKHDVIRSVLPSNSSVT